MYLYLLFVFAFFANAISLPLNSSSLALPTLRNNTLNSSLPHWPEEGARHGILDTDLYITVKHYGRQIDPK